MSKPINIVLPNETAGILDRLTTTGTRSAFISRAVLHYVEAQSRQSIRQALRDGYRANNERSLEVSAERFPLEEQVALRVEAAKTIKGIKTPRK